MNINRFCYLLLALAAGGSTLFPDPIATWIVTINMLTLTIYGVDKLAARKAWHRVPERTLLVFGVVGGWIGAILAQQIFRHKTQKQPFRTYFAVSVIFNVVAVLVTMYALHQQ